MNRRPYPYIGITDFTSHDQVADMLKVFRRYKRPGSRRMLQVGVMMNYYTLNELPSKNTSAFPAKETIGSIFDPSAAADDLYYCLHYVDHDGRSSICDLVRAVGYARPAVNAVQLDMTWPDPAMVSAIVHISKNAMSCRSEIILQIGHGAVEEIDHDEREMVRRLKSYGNSVQRVLFDTRVGEGLLLDPGLIFHYAYRVQSECPHVGIGVAGGLGPHTIHLVAPLLKTFPDLSIDAQSRLRPSGSTLDPIDWGLAEAYLIHALHMLPI